MIFEVNIMVVFVNKQTRSLKVASGQNSTGRK